MNRNRMSVLLFLIVAGAVPEVHAQVNGKSLAEKLGYARDARLLIVHADDVGVTHSVNAATIKALDTGLVNSASIMVPCPWFPEIADYAKSHPPVASKDKVPSLVDENGYFRHDWAATTKIDPREVELELRAQIDRAYAMGVHPTHLDSHQYRLYQNGKDLFDALLRIAHEYKLPVFVVRDWFPDRPYLESSLAPADIVIDHTVTIAPAVPPDKWVEFYKNALNHLQPGVTEFVIHLAFADDEMKAATRERDTWGAAWRQRDFDFFTSQEFRQLLQERNIKLVTWRELAHAVHQ